MKIEYILLSVVAVALIAFALWNFVFSVYEVRYDTSSTTLYADGTSEFTLSCVPINALGFAAPFKSSYTTFSLQEGAELVEIVSSNNDSGQIKLRAKSTPGMVTLLVKSELSLLPTSFQINILPNIA